MFHVKLKIMINYFSNYKNFELSNPENVTAWIKDAVDREGKRVGEVQYIFCEDEYLLDINKRFLQHDYYTDIVTFPLGESDKIVSGEIYISIDRVHENAEMNRVSFENELSRVIIHGVLHLIGYDDHSEEEKKEMRSKEDYYLNLLK